MFSSARRKLLFTFVPALAVLFLSSAVLAQYKEWNPVSPDELAAKNPKVESDADAEALFWEMRIDDSDSTDLDMWHYVRVKIYTERGREKYSKFDIPYAKGTKIKNLAARVIKADGSTVEIAAADIFDREIIKAGGVKIKAKSFAVPNIEPGVIIEYKYKEAVDEDGASGMRLPLQRDLPVQRLTYLYKPYNSKEPQYQAYNISNFTFKKDAKGFWLAERTNVPAFREEPRMPPEDSVRPWLLLTSDRFSVVSSSAFGLTYVVKDPSNPQKYWAAFASQKGAIFNGFLKPTKAVKRAAEAAVAGATTNEEKARRLFDFVRSEVKNLYYDPSITAEARAKLTRIKSLDELLDKKQSALPGYIDYLFASMAISQGLDVRLTFTGNRSRMFFDPKMANEHLLHFSAIAIRTGPDKFQYLNPGDPFVPFGMMPWHDEDSWGLLINEKEFLWTNTPMAKHPENRYRRSGKFTLKDDGTLEGDVVVEFTGQPAISYRQANWDETADKLSESLKESVKVRLAGAEVSQVSVENVMDISKPLVQRYKISMPNYAQKTGKRLFVQPGFFEYGPSSVFSSSTRQYSVYFQYPWSHDDEIVIKLPAGFELDNADSPGELSDASKIGLLDISMQHDKSANTLIYKRKFYFGNHSSLIFPATSYPVLKTVFDTFHKADTHTITLKQN